MDADEPKPNDRAPPPKRGRDRRLWAAGAAVLLLIALVVGRAIHTHDLYARLLRPDADKIALDPALARFAAARAKPVFAKECASCHGAEMKGDPARGVPNLTDQDWLYGEGRVPQIEQIILYGIRSGHPRTWKLSDMPALGQPVPSRTYPVKPLTPPQIRDVVEYLRLLGNKDADPSAAERGARIYADSGACYDCHATDGAGDTAIGAPDLIDDIWLYGDGSRQSVFKSIAGGHQGVCPAWAGRLSAGDVRAMAIYLHNVAADQKGKRS